MAEDVTTHNNTVRPDRMEYLTTSDRVPERLLRLERSLVNSYAALPLDGWHLIGAAGEPGFENGWVNYDVNTYPLAGYRKNPFGRVYLKGLIRSGAVGAFAFTLPAGYRPPRYLHLAADSLDTFCTVRITPGGGVQIGAPANAGWASLDGISFDSETVTTFPAGPPGASGPTGPQGIQGIQGIKGDIGNTGPQGEMEVYQQPATPPTTNIGALWIDTDEVPSSTQNLVPTGPAGGALAGNYPNPTLARQVGDFVDFRSTGPQVGSGVTVNSGAWVDSGTAARQIVYTTPAYTTRARITYKARWDRAGSGWGWGSGGLNISPAPVFDYDGVYATTPPGCARNIMIGENPTVLYFTPEGTFFADLAPSTTYTLSHAFYASSPWRMDNSMALASIALEVFVR